MWLPRKQTQIEPETQTMTFAEKVETTLRKHIGMEGLPVNAVVTAAIADNRGVDTERGG